MADIVLDNVIAVAQRTGERTRSELPDEFVTDIPYAVYTQYIEWCEKQPTCVYVSRRALDQRRRINNRHLAKRSRERRTAEIAELRASNATLLARLSESTQHNQLLEVRLHETGVALHHARNDIVRLQHELSAACAQMTSAVPGPLYFLEQ